MYTDDDGIRWDETMENHTMWAIGDRFEDHTRNPGHESGVIDDIRFCMDEGEDGDWIAFVTFDEGVQTYSTMFGEQSSRELLKYLSKTRIIYPGEPGYGE